MTRSIRDFSEGSAGIRWTPPDQLHFTLKFLGEHAPDMPARLAPVLHEAATVQSAFELALGPGGFFPSRGEPRVLWLGLTQGNEAITRLAAGLETACGKIGLPREERLFQPHLTVGRVKAVSAKFDRHQLATGVSGRMVVESFALVESILGPRGSVYRELDRFALGKSGIDPDCTGV